MLVNKETPIIYKANLRDIYCDMLRPEYNGIELMLSIPDKICPVYFSESTVYLSGYGIPDKFCPVRYLGEKMVNLSGPVRSGPVLSGTVDKYGLNPSTKILLSQLPQQTQSSNFEETILMHRCNFPESMDFLSIAQVEIYNVQFD